MWHHFSVVLTLKYRLSAVIEIFEMIPSIQEVCRCKGFILSVAQG